MYTRFTAVAASVLLVSCLASPAGARPREVRGSFTASAMPLPSPWILGPASGCSAGIEGVHKVSHPFVAPFAGWLHVKMTFEGDWDLYLEDGTGERLASSEHQGWMSESVERLTYYLEAGEETVLVACNYLSETEAEASYKLTAGPAWGSDAGRKKISRVEELPYTGPAAATPDLWGICYVGLHLGCTATEPWSTDRYVSAEVVDDVSPNVSFEIYQYNGSTYLGGQTFCSSTDGPIPVKPGADFIGASLYLGACTDGTPAMPTKGTVLMKFSNR